MHALPSAPIREEWAVSKFRLQQGSTSWLSTSPILPQPALVGVRFVIALFCFVVFILAGIEEAGPKFFIYLTNWGFAFLTLWSVGAFLLSLQHYRVSMSSGGAELLEENWQWYHSAQVLLTSLTCDTAILVTPLYYILLTANLGFTSTSTHAINTALVLLELLFISNIKITILHIVYSGVWGAAYLIFTVIYTLSGGTDSSGNPYIYSSLSWKDRPGSAAAIALPVILIVFPAVHLLLFALCKLRMHLLTKIGRTSSGATTESC